MIKVYFLDGSGDIARKVMSFGSKFGCYIWCKGRVETNSSTTEKQWGIWRMISDGWDEFLQFTRLEVGNGRRILNFGWTLGVEMTVSKADFPSCSIVL